MTQGELIDQLVTLRDNKRELERQLKNVETRYNEAKQQLINQFTADGTFAGKTARGAATLTERTIVSASDMDAFWGFVLDSRDTSLVSYARPASKACQELIALGTEIPGVTLLTQQDINLRSA